MGRRGPVPEPTQLKVLKGNPGKRPLPKNEPQPRRVRPTRPTWLDPVAAKEWQRCVKILFPLGLLTEADGVALASYCHAYSAFQEAQAIIRREGQTELDSKGMTRLRPEMGIIFRSLGIIRQFCQEFGMTPSARSRMQVPGKPDAEDPMEEMLSGRS